MTRRKFLVSCDVPLPARWRRWPPVALERRSLRLGHGGGPPAGGRWSCRRLLLLSELLLLRRRRTAGPIEMLGDGPLSMTCHSVCCFRLRSLRGQVLPPYSWRRRQGRSYPQCAPPSRDNLKDVPAFPQWPIPLIA